MSATIRVTPTTAAPGELLNIDGAGWNPKGSKFSLTTTNAAGQEVGQTSNTNRVQRDGTFHVGVYAPPMEGPAKVTCYQGTTKVEAPVTVATAVTPPDPAYTFLDDFDGTALSPKWGHHWTCCPGGLMAPLAYVKDGLLHLPVHRRSDGQWDKDLIDTRDSFKQQYGLFEARIKVVDAPGLWPAFWLYDGVFGTDGDEIDVVELLGNEGMAAAHQTVHKGTAANQVYAPWSAVTQFGSATDWHVYGVDWRPDHIAFLIDGKETWRETSLLISKPLAILLNHGVGGWAGSPDATTPSGAEVLVDWVRATK